VLLRYLSVLLEFLLVVRAKVTHVFNDLRCGETVTAKYMQRIRIEKFFAHSLNDLVRGARRLACELLIDFIW
jgi:hypothetical protein